jgi:hypothetical protein
MIELSGKALSETMKREVLALLSANQLYEPDSYGWLGPDVDPDFVGHAMNQTDSLAFRVLDARMEAMQSRSALLPNPADWERFLIRSGGDFEGLMNSARLAIGLALFENGANPATFTHHNEMFQLHLISSVVVLGSASDRIRDFFIAANFQINTKKYQAEKRREKGDRNAFVAPFEEAAELNRNVPHVLPNLDALPALAAEVSRYRHMRHGIVHDVATESGRRYESIANDPPPTPYDEMEFEYDEMISAASLTEESYSRCIAGSLARSVDWYKNLIEASNHVFVVEYRMRQHRRLIGV